MEIAIFFFLLVLTGGVACKLVLPKAQVGDSAFIILFTGLFFPAYLLFALSAANIFSPTVYLSILGILISLGAGVVLFRKKRLNLKNTIVYYENRYVMGFHLIVLVLFLFYLKAPFEFVHAAALDAANYVIQAAYQLEHSNLLFQDSQWAQYGQFFPKGSYKINSVTAFAPNFPFPPLNKVLLTTAMLFNLKLSFYIHMMLGVIGYLAIYTISKRCFESVATQLITPVVAISYPAYVYYSVLPMSEMLLLVTMLSALAVGFISNDTGSKKLAILSGFIFGSIFAIRTEVIIYFLPWVTMCMFYIISSENTKGRGVVKYILITSVISAFLFLLPTIESGGTYLKNHLGSLYHIQTYILVGVLILSFLVVLGNKLVGYPFTWMSRIVESKRIAWVLGVGLFLTILMLFYFRYWIPLDLNHEIRNINHFWNRMFRLYYTNIFINYTSYFLINTGILGIALIFIRRRVVLYPIILLYICASIVTLVNPHHKPTDYWLVRRYLICFYPLLIFSSAAFFDTFFSKAKPYKWVTVVLIAFWLIPTGKNVYDQNLRRKSFDRGGTIGLTDKFQKHADIFDTEKDVVIVSGNASRAAAYQLGMRYMFKVETLSPRLNTITDDQLIHFVKTKNEEEKDVYIIGLDEKFEKRFQLLNVLTKIDQGHYPAIEDSILYRIDL